MFPNLQSETGYNPPMVRKGTFSQVKERKCANLTLSTHRSSKEHKKNIFITDGNNWKMLFAMFFFNLKIFLVTF